VKDSLPIGVFDSGLGGLTVLEELRRALPREDFVYLGDVARLPYGTKSGNVVRRYAQRCVDFLLGQPVKAVIIACNTATAVALESVREQTQVPVYGVIHAGAFAGQEATSNGRILVLATESTVRSEAYLRAFHSLSDKNLVEQIACPLLVPLAEAGWFDHPITKEVIRTYLAQAKHKDYDTVVLGCTHYPLLLPSFRAVMGEEVRLVHSGAALARELEQELTRRSLVQSGGAPGKLRFFTTDPVSSHVPIVSTLFGSSVEFELVDL